MSIPGYVDLQVNGYIGVDYSSEELTADDFVLSAEKLIESGTYMFLPTIITSPMERYQRNIELILTVVEKEGLQEHIPGIHLEGPFLCPQPGAIGAHNPEWAKEPNIKDAETLVNYCGDKLKIMTVAAGEPNIDIIGVG